MERVRERRTKRLAVSSEPAFERLAGEAAPPRRGTGERVLPEAFRIDPSKPRPKHRHRVRRTSLRSERTPHSPANDETEGGKRSRGRTEEPRFRWLKKGKPVPFFRIPSPFSGPCIRPRPVASGPPTPFSSPNIQTSSPPGSGFQAIRAFSESQGWLRR